MKSDSYCLSYVSICFNLRNNFLNLLSGVIQSGRRVATYTYASDEMKLSVVGADGRGYEYYGSLIYQINGSSLTFESAGFNEGRIYSGGACYHIKDHLGSIRLVMDQTGSVKEQNDYYPFGMRQERSNYALFAGNRFKYNGKEEQTTGGLGYLDYGARMYDAESGRWFGVDPLLEKYYGLSPYAYCGNNPLIYIDPDGKVVVALNKSAQKSILNTLSKEDLAYVRFNDNGILDVDLLNSSESLSGNFNSLKQLANDRRTFEFNVTDKIIYKDENGNLIEKSLGVIYQGDDKNGSFGFNTGEERWQGITQTTGNDLDKYNSPNDKIRIVVNSGLSEAGRAQMIAHEAYGHADLYSKGEPHKHQAIGLKETNTKLAIQIIRAIKETIKNMEEIKNGK